MSLTTVAALRSTLGVGTLYPDDVLQSVCDASDAVMLPMLWGNSKPIIATKLTSNVATLYFEEAHGFTNGQTITVSAAGSALNGSKTISDVTTLSFSISATAADYDMRPLAPYGLATSAATTDWTTDSAVINASLMIAVEIWQSRTTTLSGANLQDYQPSPYRMSAQLLAKVRGLIAHALSPNSMVG